MPSRQNAPDDRLVFRVATTNAIQDLKKFIETSGDVNVRTSDLNTLLHCASFNPNPGAVRLLLEHGADVDARNKWEETPLHVACRLGHVRVSFILLKYSANINAQDRSGRTPLNWACRSGSLETVNLLLSKGADPEIADEYGCVAVDYAAALSADKTERGHIVGTFFRYGHGVQKLTLSQDAGKTLPVE